MGAVLVRQRAQATADTYLKHVRSLAVDVADQRPWDLTSGRLEIQVAAPDVTVNPTPVTLDDPREIPLVVTVSPQPRAPNLVARQHSAPVQIRLSGGVSSLLGTVSVSTGSHSTQPSDHSTFTRSA